MKIQASSIYRIINCPGSLPLEHSIEDDLRYRPFKDAASLGTKIHDIGEGQLNALAHGVKCRSIPTDLKKAGIEKGTYDYEKGLTAVKEYKKHFKKILTKHERKFWVQDQKIEIETKFRTDFLQYDCVAKADALLITINEKEVHLDIFDLKTGNYDYTESAKEQLIYSAFLYLVKNASPSDGKVYYITYHIIQPNYWESAHKVVSESLPELIYGTIYSQFLDLINEIKNNAETFHTGDWCSFCPALLACPKVTNLHQITDVLVKKHQDQLPDMTNEKLEYIWKHKALIEKFLSGIDDQIKTRLNRGEQFNEICLVPAYGHRRWIDTKTVEKKLKHLGADRYENPKLKSPAQMEKIAGKKNIEGLYEKPQYNKVALKDLTNDFKKIEE